MVDMMIEREIKYVIECVDDKCTLSSIVETNFGGPAQNFICEGTLEYCREVEKRLKGK